MYRSGRAAKRSHLPLVDNRRIMKQYKYLFKKCTEDEIIRQAYKNLRKGKTKREAIRHIDANLDEYVEKMQVIIKNSHPGAKYPELGFFPPKKRKLRAIKEGGKTRMICMPSIIEQWVHHIIVLVFGPIVERHSYAFSCGSMPGRGAHYGMRHIKKAIRDGGKNLKYYIKIDIRHFYATIRHDELVKVLRQRIKDEWFIALIMRCLLGFKKGLPLGFYISQWLANYFLEELDFVIARTPGVTAHTRYVDDMIVYVSNKKKAHKLLSIIARFLGRKRRLKLKRNYQIVRFDYVKKNGDRIGRPLDVMGFVFYRDRIIMRKRIMLRATRTARRVADAKSTGRKIPIKQARRVISLLGWFKHTDSYDCYLKHIKPFLSVKRIKSQISIYSKVRCNHDRLDTGTFSTAA